MGMFLTTTLVLSLLYLIVKQVVRIYHGGNLQGGDRRRLCYVLLVEVAGIGVIMISEDFMLHEVVACVALCTMGLYYMTLSFIPKKLSHILQYFTIIVILTYILYRVTGSLCNLPLPSLIFSLNITISVSLLVCLIYVLSLVSRISDVKFVLKSGAVWNSVCLITDIVYIMILLFNTVTYYLININFPNSSMWVHALFSLSMISIQYALSVRVNKASLFVFWEEHERRIIESMKLSHSDLTGESPGIDVLYKSIYDRVIDYFDSQRPYLNNDLTINDIVNVLYTNKLYISKAISMYTGRNFCQFVNYYRVTYAVELFRKDTTLKIVDVASRSGFNSSVSFSMAFRLYMGDKPGDWFRRERARLSKRKNDLLSSR